MSLPMKTYPDAAGVIQAAADLFLSLVTNTISALRRFSVSLSGGTTPRALYQLLAQPTYRDRIDWAQVDFFWGDERCVPPDHPDSDFGMARAALLDHLPKYKQPRVFRLKGEADPQTAADEYEGLLREYFGNQALISFDLLLLGLGEDAHTASLFPGTDAIHEQQRWVVGHYVPKLSAYRLTLTPPILNRANQTVFLVTGANKRPALEHVLSGPYQPDLYPAQVIQPMNGKIVYLTDQTL
jgi:6-phosphogluconolactonase